MSRDNSNSSSSDLRRSLRWGLLTMFLTSWVVALQIIRKQNESFKYLANDDGWLLEEEREAGNGDDQNEYYYNGDFIEEEEEDDDGDDYGDDLSNPAESLGLDLDTDLNITLNPDSDIHLDLDNMLDMKIHKLEQMEPIPFYMYDHPNITLESTPLRMFGKRMFRIAAEASYDLATIHALNSSSWRTHDPSQAKLYIIPIPLGRIASSVQMDYIKLTFDTLLNTTLFQQTKGRSHVLPASPFLLFRGDKPKQHGIITPYMPYLWNVTISSSYDQNAIINAIQDQKDGSRNFDFKEYTPTFSKLNALNKYTFSTGLSGGTSTLREKIYEPLKSYHFPLTLASTSKFYNSSNFILYHTPPNFTCFHNSTIFRMAPITNITVDAFPKSSIGHGIRNRQLWIDTFKDSKFCLCIRGDSPHSHAFFRSVRSGCIPVIASSTLPIYSPILKHTLDMEDYTIIIDEEELIQNTHNVLLKLQDLDEEYIQMKIKNLQFAQRVWFHDHPESLFVNAYLHEAMHASEVDDSLNPYGGDQWR